MTGADYFIEHVVPNFFSHVSALFVANSGNGALFVVDTTSDDPVADARAITLREGDRTGVSLCGPDGLLEQLGPTDGADLVVVENGSCTAATPRVVQIYLAGDWPD